MTMTTKSGWVVTLGDDVLVRRGSDEPRTIGREELIAAAQQDEFDPATAGLAQQYREILAAVADMEGQERATRIKQQLAETREWRSRLVLLLVEAESVSPAVEMAALRRHYGIKHRDDIMSAYRLPLSELESKLRAIITGQPA